MSSAVHGNWLHHFRRLQDSAAPALDRLRNRLKESIMPAAVQSTELDPFDPENFVIEQAPNGKWVSRKEAREARQARAEAQAPSLRVEITKDVLAGREEPVSYARISAHGGARPAHWKSALKLL